MKTCSVCNCPLMVMAKETRTKCARCTETPVAAKSTKAPKTTTTAKVYRAPRHTPKDPSMLKIDEFLQGRTKRGQLYSDK